MTALWRWPGAVKAKMKLSGRGGWVVRRKHEWRAEGEPRRGGVRCRRLHEQQRFEQAGVPARRVGERGDRTRQWAET